MNEGRDGKLLPSMDPLAAIAPRSAACNQTAQNFAKTKIKEKGIHDGVDAVCMVERERYRRLARPRVATGITTHADHRLLKVEQTYRMLGERVRRRQE